MCDISAIVELSEDDLKTELKITKLGHRKYSFPSYHYIYSLSSPPKNRLITRLIQEIKNHTRTPLRNRNSIYLSCLLPYLPSNPLIIVSMSRGGTVDGKQADWMIDPSEIELFEPIGNGFFGYERELLRDIKLARTQKIY